MIGFGETEIVVQNETQAAITRRIICEYTADRDAIFFTDEFVQRIREWVKQLAEASRERAASFKESPLFPDRYSSFYAVVLHDASHIAVLLKFHHINRRHTYSPDGWAGLQTDVAFFVHEWDAGRAKRANTHMKE